MGFLELAQSTLLVSNGIFQLFIPFQTVYAVVYGKESARQYFDYQAFIGKGAEFQPPPRAINRAPRYTMQQIVANYPISPEVDLVLTKISSLPFTLIIPPLFALPYVHPHYFFQLLRGTCVA